MIPHQKCVERLFELLKRALDKVMAKHLHKQGRKMIYVPNFLQIMKNTDNSSNHNAIVYSKFYVKLN